MSISPKNASVPIFAQYCFECHGAAKQTAGLRLDRAASLKKGGDSGPVIVPGKPDESLLIRAIRRDGELKMPPKTALPPQAVADLTEWVRRGAAWSDAPAVGGDRRRHWAFQPIADPPVPTVQLTMWPRNSIDRFILAKIEAAGVNPSPPTDKRRLIRRVTFDLTGLPPTPEEVDAFLSDDSRRRLRESRWTGCWRRRDTASAGAGTGSTSPATPTPRATSSSRTPIFPGPTPTAITSSGRSTRICPTIVSCWSSSPPIGCPDSRATAKRRPLTGAGLPDARRPLHEQRARYHRRSHRRGDARPDGADGRLRPLPRSQVRPDSDQADYYSLYGVFASCVEPEVPPLFEPPPDTPAFRSFQKEMDSREQRLRDFIRSQVRSNDLMRQRVAWPNI